MNAYLRYWSVLTLVTVLWLGLPTDAHAADLSQAETAFNRLKALAGEWHGRSGDREKGETASATYKVTAAGNTVMETLFPGTPQEMVTMYYLEEGKLMLTRYCTGGNQPKMALTKQSTTYALDFNFISGANIKSRRDPHMRAARLRFLGRNGLETEWDFFEDGRKSDTKKFFLSRK